MCELLSVQVVAIVASTGRATDRSRMAETHFAARCKAREPGSVDTLRRHQLRSRKINHRLFHKSLEPPRKSRGLVAH